MNAGCSSEVVVVCQSRRIMGLDCGPSRSRLLCLSRPPICPTSHALPSAPALPSPPHYNTLHTSYYFLVFSPPILQLSPDSFTFPHRPLLVPSRVAVGVGSRQRGAAPTQITLDEEAVGVKPRPLFLPVASLHPSPGYADEGKERQGIRPPISRAPGKQHVHSRDCISLHTELGGAIHHTPPTLHVYIPYFFTSTLGFFVCYDIV
ncbi:hypothetical protein Pmani_025517 [Petrolisthes manimaculis]|uniref:Uncharacterized protein n=1 Tax=Petrolisthes manimaculis TaxID=1843537 RepID=A0AAE1U138_9EUCA|nr:hypothetical protein Pmani_025517 [Petrolisthes manimaculis]